LADAGRGAPRNGNGRSEGQGATGSRELVCIACPTGCRIRVKLAADDDFQIRGAACSRGQAYALSELVDPARTFTGTVRVQGGDAPVVPVRSEGQVPKGAMLEVARIAARLVARAPIEMGDPLGEDMPGGTRLVATASVRAVAKP
jgi:CxxC motif-containing protein